MHPSHYIHVGIWLKEEIVEPHGLSVNDTADHLGVTRQTVSRLINGHQNLSADMALRFEKVFGIKADTLLRMQIGYDLAQARLHEGDLAVKPLAA
jgi:addiction module HigA family antidote